MNIMHITYSALEIKFNYYSSEVRNIFLDIADSI